MKLIAITSEQTAGYERKAIIRLVESGFHRIHIRKPHYDFAAMRALIESLPEDIYPWLTLHDHHVLAAEYGLGGIHLNSRNPVITCTFTGHVSRSCHSFDEVCAHDCDYYFLSPVFDSISKRNYRGAFNGSQLCEALSGPLAGREVYALGGVDALHLSAVHRLGFAGAALLGAIWRGQTYEDITANIDEIWKNSNL